MFVLQRPDTTTRVLGSLRRQEVWFGKLPMEFMRTTGPQFEPTFRISGSGASVDQPATMQFRKALA